MKYAYKNQEYMNRFGVYDLKKDDPGYFNTPGGYIEGSNAKRVKTKNVGRP